MAWSKLMKDFVEKKSYVEKLRELAQDYERVLRMRPQERVKEQLQWENWPELSREAVAYAERELKRRGRGRRSVLPGGYDGESIAGEAVADMLAGKSRLVCGWTRPRLMRELERLIRGKIRLLRMLKEGSVTCSESEAQGRHKQVDGQGPDGFEALAAQEQESRRERVKREVEEFLAGEPELVDLFGCWWKGIRNEAEVARRLGLDEQAVKSARRRLERRLAKWRTLRAAVMD